MADLDSPFFEKLWASCFCRIRRPVEGVLMSDEKALRLCRELWDRYLTRYAEIDSKASFSSEILEEGYERARHAVREERAERNDPQLYHDPADERYEANLNLAALQKRDAADGERFSDREWEKLAPFLRPFGFSTLYRKGIRDQDAEDVFIETFAELPRLKGAENRAAIEAIKVFEEVIPLFTKMLQFRAIDWLRRQSALKNQPNTQESFEELTEVREHARQFEDKSARAFGNPADLTFDRIYELCEDSLSPLEWELVFAVHVGQTHTMGELVEEEEILEKLELSRRDSVSKKRRILNDHLHGALRKLAKALEN